MKATIFLTAFVGFLMGFDSGLMAGGADFKNANPSPGSEQCALCQAQADFKNFWHAVRSDPQRKKLYVPQVVIWLNGAPGAGKGTNASYIQDIFSITQPPLVTSDLLNSPEFKAIKDSGKLVSDSDVTGLVFSNILKKQYVRGVVVDGYPRTETQSECIKLLCDAIEEMGLESDFRVVILDVSEETSIERQLGRGRRAMANNESVRRTGNGDLLPVRATDSDPDAARTRYQVFMKQTDDALRILQGRFPCCRIQADGSFDDVRQNIYDSLGNPKN
ncbi:MAG: nucleoside monophosphate kinase [Puniceicoccales bacterium]|jgi:adenylate kinase|nr:nucleoside monophosphate kinase [Puniceicoccales bacterium]